VGQTARHRKHDLNIVRQTKLPPNSTLKLNHAFNAGTCCYDVRAAVDLDGHWDALHELVVVWRELARCG
jgi:hypothetical protein